jgi:hypothetical protein
LARNTVWSLLGSLSRIVAGAIAVPAIIRGIGAERFGVLSIAWIAMGYVGLLDLGLGRALTKLVAEKAGDADEAGIVSVTWTSLLLLFFLGIFGGITMYLLSPWLVHRVLKVPAGLQTETLRGFFCARRLDSPNDSNIRPTRPARSIAAIQGPEPDQDAAHRVFVWRSFIGFALLSFPRYVVRCAGCRPVDWVRRALDRLFPGSARPSAAVHRGEASYRRSLQFWELDDGEQRLGACRDLC